MTQQTICKREMSEYDRYDRSANDVIASKAYMRFYLNVSHHVFSEFLYSTNEEWQ